MRRTSLRLRAMRGFTLLEAVATVAVFAVLASALTIGMHSASRKLEVQLRDDDAATYARDMVERILADRRNPGLGFKYIKSANYPAENWSTGTMAGMARGVSLITLTAGQSSGPYAGLCPTLSAGCQVVTVTVSDAGTTRAALSFLLTSPLSS